MVTSSDETLLIRLRARRVTVTAHHVTVEFVDGRTVSLPISWYPRLAHSRPEHRSRVEISHSGIYWPDIDDGMSYEAIIFGRKSGEGPQSFAKWLSYYSKGKLPPIRELPMPKSRCAKKKQRVRK